MLPGSSEKRRPRKLGGAPGAAASSVLMMRIRSTPALFIAASTEARFFESNAVRSELVRVTPIAVSTASESLNASASLARSPRSLRTSTREPSGIAVMRSGRERTIAVKRTSADLHTRSMPCPRPPAAPITATLAGMSCNGDSNLESGMSDQGTVLSGVGFVRHLGLPCSGLPPWGVELGWIVHPFGATPRLPMLWGATECTRLRTT